METNWTTLLLEILNFLVLVWLLKRFLYKPVLNAIAQRKARIDQMVADAQRIRDESEALRMQYDNRLVGWDQERKAAHANLKEEIGAERGRLMADLQAALQREREKSAAVEERRLIESTRRAEAQALAQGSQFAARFLFRLADSELEARIVALVLDDLAQLRKDEQQALRTALSAAQQPVRIVSAYPLQQHQREVLTRTLAVLTDGPVNCAFGEDPTLLAGLRLSAGAWMLRASLQDELKFFAESANAHTGHS